MCTTAAPNEGDRNLEAEGEILNAHRSVTQPLFEWSFGHRHEKPFLEDQEGNNRNAGREREDGDPGGRPTQRM